MCGRDLTKVPFNSELNHFQTFFSLQPVTSTVPPRPSVPATTPTCQTLTEKWPLSYSSKMTVFSKDRTLKESRGAKKTHSAYFFVSIFLRSVKKWRLFFKYANFPTHFMYFRYMCQISHNVVRVSLRSDMSTKYHII